MSEHDDDFGDGHDNNIKAYFSGLFKDRSRLWKEFKSLLANVNQESEVSNYRENLHQTDGIESLFVKPNDDHIEEEEDLIEEEGWEIEVLNANVEAPTLKKIEPAAKKKEQEEVIPSARRVFRDRDVSLDQNQDLVGEVREVIIRAPKKKDTAPAPTTQEPLSEQNGSEHN